MISDCYADVLTFFVTSLYNGEFTEALFPRDVLDF